MIERDREPQAASTFADISVLLQAASSMAIRIIPWYQLYRGIVDVLWLADIIVRHAEVMN